MGEVIHKAGISEATFYDWCKKYADLMPTRLKATFGIGVQVT